MPGPTEVYRAFGLRIASEIRLPGLPAGPGAPDVRIRRGSRASVEEMRAERLGPWPDGCAVVAHPEVGLFRVEAGRAILVRAAAGAPDAVLVPYLLGRCMAAILRQRGVLVLHGAVVLRPRGGAAAILGASGWGKSTVARAAIAAGATLVADDLTALTPAPGGPPRVLPGPPLLRLAAPADSEAGGGRPAGAKRATAVAAASAPAPLGTVAVLDPAAAAPAAEKLAPREAFVALLAQTYAPEHLPDERAHFAAVAALAAAVPCYRLGAPRGGDPRRVAARLLSLP